MSLFINFTIGCRTIYIKKISSLLYIMIKLGQRLKNSVVGMGMKYGPTAFSVGQWAVLIMNVLWHPITQAVAHKAISVLEKSSRRKHNIISLRK